MSDKPKKPTPTRLYAVRVGERTRLVEATSPAQAVGHVYGSEGLVDVATAMDAARLVSSGVQVERAKPENQPSLPLDLPPAP